MNQAQSIISMFKEEEPEDELSKPKPRVKPLMLDIEKEVIPKTPKGVNIVGFLSQQF